MKLTVRPEEGVNDPVRLTLLSKYPTDVTVTSMFVLELWTKVTWLAVAERLKSRGNAIMVSTGVCTALCVRPALVVPVIVIGYVPAGVLTVAMMLIIELKVGLPLVCVKE